MNNSTFDGMMDWGHKFSIWVNSMDVKIFPSEKVYKDIHHDGG